MTRTEKENLVPVWERITICSWNHADKPDGHFKDIWIQIISLKQKI